MPRTWERPLVGKTVGAMVGVSGICISTKIEEGSVFPFGDSTLIRLPISGKRVLAARFAGKPDGVAMALLINHRGMDIDISKLQANVVMAASAVQLNAHA